jgi:hypothetical protein
VSVGAEGEKKTCEARRSWIGESSMQSLIWWITLRLRLAHALELTHLSAGQGPIMMSIGIRR